MASCLAVSVPRRKTITLDRNTVVMASRLTVFVPRWNRMAVILDKVIMVMSSYLTVSMLRRKIITLDGITVVIARCLTVIVPSWN